MAVSDRDQVLKRARCVVVKVGSAVLTATDGLDLRVVNRLADQLATLHDQGRHIVLVSSGAVAAGRRDILSKGELALPLKQAASAVGQGRLMRAYEDAFERYGKSCAQILLTRYDLKSRQRYLNARNTFATLLEKRIIPVVNENDTVAVDELQFGDNDALATLLLNVVEGELLINLTSAQGVCSGNPAVDSQAKLMPEIQNIHDLDLERLCQGKTSSGSGGMYSKLLAARRAAQLGVPTLIVSGQKRFVLERVFGGEPLGTWVGAEKRAVSRRKFWMAYNLDPAGSLVVDNGAARALRDKGRSLLPAGVIEVQGDFEEGALVRILDASGEVIGVGLSNYGAEALRKIQGRSSQCIQEALGECPYEEVVHRDNLLLDAAF
ncbi:MAG: glutamate 5-kinase [Thermodesulfobacteriota bacterium]